MVDEQLIAVAQEDDLGSSERCDAISALATSGSETAINALLNLYRNDKDNDSVREHIIKLLFGLATSHRGDESPVTATTHDQIIETLIAALQDEYYGIRSDVAEVIHQLHDQRTIAPLIATLNDEEEGVRFFAAQSLGRLDDKSAIEPLIACLKDWDEFDDREVLVNALARLCRDDLEPVVSALADAEIRPWLFEVIRVVRRSGDAQLPTEYQQEWQDFKQRLGPIF